MHDDARSTTRAPRVLVAGLRSPDAEGGIESHARHLYPHIARLGCDVEIVVRRLYHPPSKSDVWQGIRLKPLWSPRVMSLETLVHTLLATVYAIRTRPDIYHLHAVGPALFAPLARLFGLKVVVTHHGPDYDREKWGRAGRLILRLGEYLGMRFANGRIVISRTIRDLVQQKYHLTSTVIPNGVDLPAPSDATALLAALGLQPGRYVLQVSRFVPEKRQADLVQAFLAANLSDDWRLVLVGSAGADNRYAQRVRELCAGDERVVFAGFRSGTELAELTQNAALFVLPSSHEGLPIALLEALSHGLPVIASDIAANLEVGLPAERYFPLGDLAALTQRIEHTLQQPRSADAARELRQWVAERYDWRLIAEETAALYRSILD